MPKKTDPLALPEWLDADLWAEFLTHRKTLKKPMTDYAQKLAFKVLERFKKAGHDPRASVEQSILNGWQGLFEPKAASTLNRQEALEASNRRVGENWLASRKAQRGGADDAIH